MGFSTSPRVIYASCLIALFGVTLQGCLKTDSALEKEMKTKNIPFQLIGSPEIKMPAPGVASEHIEALKVLLTKISGEKGDSPIKVGISAGCYHNEWRLLKKAVEGMQKKPTVHLYPNGFTCSTLGLYSLLNDNYDTKDENFCGKVPAALKGADVKLPDGFVIPPEVITFLDKHTCEYMKDKEGWKRGDHVWSGGLSDDAIAEYRKIIKPSDFLFDLQLVGVTSSGTIANLGENGIMASNCGYTATVRHTTEDPAPPGHAKRKHTEMVMSLTQKAMLKAKAVVILVFGEKKKDVAQAMLDQAKVGNIEKTASAVEYSANFDNKVTKNVIFLADEAALKGVKAKAAPKLDEAKIQKSSFVEDLEEVSPFPYLDTTHQQVHETSEAEGISFAGLTSQSSNLKLQIQNQRTRPSTQESATGGVPMTRRLGPTIGRTTVSSILPDGVVH